MFEFLNRPKVETADAAPAEAKASAPGHAIAWPGAGRVAWSPRDVVSLTRTGFTGNPIGFRAVKIIAEAAAALPVVLQDQERRFETHPIQALLARPNAGQGRAEILEALYGQLLLTGNGYLEGVGDEGLPIELHVLRSDRMSIVPGADGWPVAYEYPVVHLRKSETGSLHHFSWIRATQIDGDIWSATDVPVGETTEEYEVTVRQGGQIVFQTKVTASTWVFSDVAQQSVLGVGAYQMSVAQISERYGPGPVVSMTIVDHA